MMTDFRRMTEAAFKMWNPETWPLQEVTEEGDTGQLEFVLLPTLFALDRVMLEANRAARAGDPGGNQAPSNPLEFKAIERQMRQSGVDVYYVNFRKTFAQIMGPGPVSKAIWEEAIGWDDPYGYHIGKLTRALQSDTKLRRALGQSPDSADGRRATWDMFARACPFLVGLPCTRNVYWPPMRAHARKRGPDGNPVVMSLGLNRNTTGQLLITKGYDKYAFIWKFSEEHLPIQPTYDTWLWFYNSHATFKKVVSDLTGFLKYSIKLANGVGTYRGLQHTRTRRTWALVCARRLVFLIDELGILDERVCGRQDPFALLTLSRVTNDVETIYDPKLLAQRYERLNRLNEECSKEEFEMAGMAGPINWCDPRDAGKIFNIVSKWCKLLKQEKMALTHKRAADSDRYWAQQAHQLSTGELGRGVAGRPIVAPELEVVSAASDSSRPPPEKRRAPDDSPVQLDNMPPDKRHEVRQGVPVQPPLNNHPRDQLDGIAVPELEAGSRDPSRAPSQAPGVDRPPGEGRSKSREAELVGNGQLQNADALLDDDVQMPDAEPIKSEVVSAQGNQGARPRVVPVRGFVRPVAPDRGRKRSRESPALSLRKDDPGPRRSRSRSRGREDVLIAQHPQANVVNMDIPAMLEQVIAQEIEQMQGLADPQGVAKRVKEMFAELGQPQQANTHFHEAVPPTTDRSTGTVEASGYFVFNESHDGRLYGVVSGYSGPKAQEAQAFTVMVVGGDRDGRWEKCSLDQGIYRAAGPFPVLSLAAVRASTAGR